MRENKKNSVMSRVKDFKRDAKRGETAWIYLSWGIRYWIC